MKKRKTRKTRRRRSSKKLFFLCFFCNIYLVDLLFGWVGACLVGGLFSFPLLFSITNIAKC